jgi:hypothetical protein
MLSKKTFANIFADVFLHPKKYLNFVLTKERMFDNIMLY